MGDQIEYRPPTDSGKEIIDASLNPKALAPLELAVTTIEFFSVLQFLQRRFLMNFRMNLYNQKYKIRAHNFYCCLTDLMSPILLRFFLQHFKVAKNRPSAGDETHRTHPFLSYLHFLFDWLSKTQIRLMPRKNRKRRDGAAKKMTKS